MVVPARPRHHCSDTAGRRVPLRAAVLARVLASLAGICLAAYAPDLTAQAPQDAPVFRAEATLVEVIVRVTDENGRFVSNLTAKDFEIRDRRRPQTIVAFDYRSVPRTPVAPPSAGPPLVAPDMSTVSTNAHAAGARLFTIVLDDLGTSTSYTIPVRMAARDFVLRYTGPTDLVAVFSTGGRGVLTQEFTSDRTRVLARIERFWGTGVCGAYAAGAKEDFVEALANHLDGIRGRRVSLVWIGESGLNRTGFAGRRAIDALRRANVAVNVVDPRKLFYPVEMMTVGDREVAQTIPRWGETSCGASPNALREFAEETGGFASVNTNDHGPAFERIIEEASEYYVLGFQPSDPPRGRAEFREIEVRVPAHPKWRVSGRPGYMIQPPRPPSPRPTNVLPVLADAIVNNLPTAGLPMRVQAIPRRNARGAADVHVLVDVDGAALQFEDAGGRHREQLNFALRTIDSLARSDHNTKTTVTLALRPDELGRTRHTGVRWLSTLAVKPGAYSVRVTGHASTTGTTGGVFLDLDVPKWEDDTLWIGGLAVTTAADTQAVTAVNAPVDLGLPGPPTTRRRFAPGESFTASAQIVVPRNFRSGSVELTVQRQFAPADAPPLVSRTDPLPARTAADAPRVWTIETTGLAPGEYVLQLVLRDDRAKSARTAMTFEIRD